MTREEAIEKVLERVAKENCEWENLGHEGRVCNPETDGFVDGPCLSCDARAALALPPDAGVMDSERMTDEVFDLAFDERSNVRRSYSHLREEARRARAAELRWEHAARKAASETGAYAHRLLGHEGRFAECVTPFCTKARSLPVTTEAPALDDDPAFAACWRQIAKDPDGAADRITAILAPMAACCGCSCGRCSHQGGQDDHHEECRRRFAAAYSTEAPVREKHDDGCHLAHVPIYLSSCRCAAPSATEATVKEVGIDASDICEPANPAAIEAAFKHARKVECVDDLLDASPSAGEEET